ncbi:hypothetical protein QYF61_023250, partial [Mycteria americana]
MDTLAQFIHECETCAAIKQVKRLKPLRYGGRWLKYWYGEAWQIDYITLPQTLQGKRHQVLWRHGTPERTESDNETHFQKNPIDTWAKEHGIEWVYHIPYHTPASGKIKRYNGLLKTMLRAMGAGTFKHWDTHLAKAICIGSGKDLSLLSMTSPPHETTCEERTAISWSVCWAAVQPGRLMLRDETPASLRHLGLAAPRKATADRHQLSVHTA